jgi:hypothetical protein
MRRIAIISGLTRIYALSFFATCALVALVFCWSVTAQQNTSTVEQCNARNRVVKATLDRDNTLFWALEQNEFGNGVWFPWMAKMEKMGVKHATATVEFRHVRNELSFKLTDMLFFKTYYPLSNDKIVSRWQNPDDRVLLRDTLTIPAFIETSRLVVNLNVKTGSCGTININLLDDPCLPVRNAIPTIMSCS